MYGVGIALPGHARFFAIYNLSSAADTLHALLATLIAAGIVTTALGAVLGRWAAGRALRPLRDVSQAALAIAGGMLDTRLETADARDLAVLTSSFNRMADRLQQRIERDARFTSDVSHELRSPLTTLAAALSVIEARKDEMPERSRHALELLAAEVRRFQRMVGDLLEISRYDSRSADFEPTSVEIGELIRHASTPRWATARSRSRSNLRVITSSCSSTSDGSNECSRISSKMPTATPAASRKSRWKVKTVSCASSSTTRVQAFPKQTAHGSSNASRVAHRSRAVEAPESERVSDSHSYASTCVCTADASSSPTRRRAARALSSRSPWHRGRPWSTDGVSANGKEQ